MIINGKTFNKENKTYIMAILNVTPDSFSDGGKFNNLDCAKKQVEEMIACGADIIDVGGESTRPGHVQISEEEEIERVVPYIEMIRKEFDIAVSVDTYKSKVARASIQAGAGLVNDIWGCKYDPEMAKVIGDSGSACCLMHNRDDKNYNDFMKNLLEDMQASVEIALKGGVEKNQIILDPGVGFAKTYEQNLLAIKNTSQLARLGYPVLLGTSKKSCIGLALDLDVHNRTEGTLATTAYGMLQGDVRFFRVHDVKENARLIRMIDAIRSVEG